MNWRKRSNWMNVQLIALSLQLAVFWSSMQKQHWNFWRSNVVLLEKTYLFLNQYLECLLTSLELSNWNSRCSSSGWKHKKCAILNVSWKDMESNRERSYDVAMQSFSNNSQISLRAGSLSFHPLRLTALKAFERSRDEQIIGNKTLVTTFTVSNDNTKGGSCHNLMRFQEIMYVLGFCNLFRKLWSLLWKDCFSLHFLNSWPHLQMATNMLYTVW